MEKFTVDLEKVLDDFEFSEERDERRTSTANNKIKQVLSTPKAVLTNYEYPTPGVYKRPAFEPINLADADFSAAVQPAQQSYQSDNQRPSSRPPNKSHPSSYQPNSAGQFSSVYQPNSINYAPYASNTEVPLHIGRQNYGVNPSDTIQESYGTPHSEPGHIGANYTYPPNREASVPSYGVYRTDSTTSSYASYPSKTIGHEVSYVLPHMSSGGVLIQKTNADMSTVSSGMKEMLQNSTTLNMSSGVHGLQNEMDQIYSPPLNTGTILSTDSNLDLSIDNAPSSNSSDDLEPVKKQQSTPEQRPSLPDVATPAPAPLPKADKFDLINDRVMSAIVDSSCSSDAKPIGFLAVNKPSHTESELNKYLDELEDDEENSVEEMSSLPVVSTDDEISSSQSQVDENVTSATTTSGYDAKMEGNNSEFENLLSPESSTESCNHGDLDASGKELVANDDMHNIINADPNEVNDNGDMKNINYNVVINHVNSNPDAENINNNVHVNNADPHKFKAVNYSNEVHHLSETGDDGRKKMVQHIGGRNVDKVFAEDHREVMFGSDSNRNLESQRISVDESQTLSSNAVRITITERSKPLGTDVLCNLKEKKELNEDLDTVRPHSNVDIIETPTSLVKPEEQISGDLAADSDSAFSIERVGNSHDVPSDEIKDISNKNEKSEETTEISLQEKSVTKPTSANEARTKNDTDIVNECNDICKDPSETGEGIRETNNEHIEQIENRTDPVNNVEEQNKRTHDEENETNSSSGVIENNVNIEISSTPKSQQGMSNESNTEPGIDRSPRAAPIDSNTETTEIINTNYVVEISLLDPKDKTSPQKSIPDNANVNPEALSNTVVERFSNWSEELPSTSNEYVSNNIEKSELNVDSGSKEHIEPVPVECNINYSASGIDKQTEQNKLNLDVNMHSNVSNSLTYEESSNNVSQTNESNSNVNTSKNLANRYKDNFVHNDLVMTREKNTNLNREQNGATVASCIRVSNLKQMSDADAESSIPSDSNVSNTSVPSENAIDSHSSSSCTVTTDLSHSAPNDSTALNDSTAPNDSTVLEYSTANAVSTSMSNALSSINAPRVSNTPCISISAPSEGVSNCYNRVSSPDCYVEEKSIAESVHRTVDANQFEHRPCNEDASTSSSPVPNPQPSTSESPDSVLTSPCMTPKPVRPNSLDLPSSPSVSLSPSETPPNLSDSEPPPASAAATSTSEGPQSKDTLLGKRAPYWVPDIEAPTCMHCQARFTLVKRRHHCRACGQVLCSKCCNRRANLEYLQFATERVCTVCYDLLIGTMQSGESQTDDHPSQQRQPNPNNPMEYCSTVPPLQQIAESGTQPTPSVLVPVSVLKREGSLKSREGKQVMFSDGIKPGGDLTELDTEREVSKLPVVRKNRMIKRVGTPPGNLFHKRPLHPDSNSFIPSSGLPPVIVQNGAEINYSEITSPLGLNEAVKFAIHRNLFAHVKKIKLDCCLGKKRAAWNITSEGLSCVGQDEVVFLMQCTQGEIFPPQHIFHVILYIYTEAAQGNTVTEMSYLPSPPSLQELLASKDHGGFIFIRPAGQCTNHLTLPDPPYLFGILIHRWEIPWAKLFPLRLVLRLGASLKCYPCPLLSVRFREPVYMEVGHTIIKLLADFRSFAYTLPTVRGLLIHMEENKTSVIIPKNFYDQVVKAINLSNESHLAFAGNFSTQADSHLVCVQNVEAETAEYSTQRISCPSKETDACTGLSFILFNASLKSADGMQGKAGLHEDGLMVHLLPEGMTSLRAALHDMRPYTIPCGPHSEESVHIVWAAQDLNFNVGVRSCIDGKPLDGVQSIRVHGGTDYTGPVKLIRWSEVFILENSDLNAKTTEDPIDHMKKLSESISRATCVTLVPLLEQLSAADVKKFAVRVTIHPDDVGYEAGTAGERFDSKYMRFLDEGLVPIIHQAGIHSTSPLTLELVFRIMEQG